jgi:hypothetical protein
MRGGERAPILEEVGCRPRAGADVADGGSGRGKWRRKRASQTSLTTGILTSFRVAMSSKERAGAKGRLEESKDSTEM